MSKLLQSYTSTDTTAYNPAVHTYIQDILRIPERHGNIQHYTH